MASGLDDPSLMEGQSTEAAASKAAAVADQAEFYFRKCRNTACCVITQDAMFS